MLGRVLLIASLGSALGAGCGDDGGSAEDAGMDLDGSMADAGGEDAGTEEERDAGFDAALDGEVASFPPRIQQVSVNHAPDGSCTPGTDSTVRFTVTVEDPDTPEEELTYSGMISGCDDPIDDAVVMTTCDEGTAMGGKITVTDPEGNSNSIDIAFEACADRTLP